MYSNWVTVNLSAIQDNIRFILEKLRTPVMAIVKANAYGHGAIAVARAANLAGATWFGVARPDEALELRRVGIDTPILLLGYTPEERFDEMIAQKASITVWDPVQIRSLSAAAERTKQEARIHLKVDTGMSRLGVQPEGVIGLANVLKSTPMVKFEGLFTHFSRADEANSAFTGEQTKRFMEVLAALDDLGMRPPIVHSANSAASLSRPDSAFNLLRFGIAMYGLHPSLECLLPSAFRRALTWKSVLSQVKTLPPGRGVSYGHAYITQGTERIGTIPVGYGDGYRRVAGNHVLVGGQRVPVIGRVCMDQIMVQLDNVPNSTEGDEVVLIGRQGGEQITAEHVAETWGTINYEVTCAIGSRVPRLFE